jgi:hypothetical protein
MSLEHDPVRQKRGPGHDAMPKGPPERAAFSIREFCLRNSISRSMYYKLRRLGIGPRVMSVGVRQLITGEAEKEWQRDREAASKTFLPGVAAVGLANARQLLKVRVAGLRCSCSREVRPYDAELLDDGAVRFVCTSCHHDVLLIEGRRED